MATQISTFDLAQSYCNLEKLTFDAKIAEDESRRMTIQRDEYEQILKQLDGSTQEKLDNLNYVLQEFAGKEKTLNQKIENMRQRKKRFKNTQAKIKKLILLLLQASKKKKIETAENTFSLVHGREKLVVVNENMVPSQFTKIKIEVKKLEALQHYRAQKEVPAGLRLTRSPDYVMIRSR